MHGASLTSSERRAANGRGQDLGPTWCAAEPPRSTAWWDAGLVQARSSVASGLRTMVRGNRVAPTAVALQGAQGLGGQQHGVPWVGAAH